MAQETRINPIQLNDNAQKIIMDLGDTFEKQGLQRQQMKMKMQEQAYERKKQYENQYNELQKWYYDKASSLKASPEEINKALELGRNALSEAHLKGTDINQMMNTAQGFLGNLKYAAGVRDVVDAQVDGAAKQNPEVNQEALRMYLEKNVLAGKDPKSIDVQTNHAQSAIYDPRNWNLFDYKKSLEGYTTQIKKGPQTEESEKTVDQNGVWRTNDSKKVKFNPQFFEQDGKGGFRMKTDTDGLFAIKDYNSFVSNPANNAVLQNKANQFIGHFNAAPTGTKLRTLKEWGVPIDDVAVKDSTFPTQINKETLGDNYDQVVDNIKRAMLTHDIKSMSPTLKTESQGNIQTKITVNTGANAPEPKDVIPAINKTIEGFTVRKAADGKDIKKGAVEVGAPINKIKSAAAQSAIIKLTNDIAGKGDTKYNVEDLVIKSIGNDTYGIYDFATGKQLTTLTSDDINIAANSDLGMKVKNAAHNKAQNKKEENKKTGASGL